ncbi:MAG: hypothetical protein H0X12_07395 [Nocardioides sp.]|nr:hypothetical protein [Nocardioides sp.]
MRTPCRPGRGVSTCDQRARTDEPTCGTKAPATTAARYGVHVGHSSSTVSISAARAAPQTEMPVASTLPWPTRSTSEPFTMASAASAMT